MGLTKASRIVVTTCALACFFFFSHAAWSSMMNRNVETSIAELTASEDVQIKVYPGRANGEVLGSVLTFNRCYVLANLGRGKKTITDLGCSERVQAQIKDDVISQVGEKIIS